MKDGADVNAIWFTQGSNDVVSTNNIMLLPVYYGIK